MADIADGVEEFGAGGAFEEITGGASGEGVEDIFGVLVGGEHDDLGGGKLLLETADAFDAVDAGKIDVHEDDFGVVVGEADEGGLGGGIIADTAEIVGTVDEADEGGPQLIIVFDDGDGGGHGQL